MYETISAAGVKKKSLKRRRRILLQCFKGTDNKGGAIDFLRLPDSQISFPILYATNHIREEELLCFLGACC